MWDKIGILLFTFTVFASIEYRTSHLNWKPVSLIHHVITASTANYLLFTEPDKMYSVTNYNASDYYPIYRYLPLISCAYGYFDLYYAIIKKQGPDFLFHGVFFIGTTSWALYNNAIHFMYPGLLLETSSIFLTLMPSYPFMKYPFCASFLLYRNILVPYLTYNWFYTMKKLYEPNMNEEKMIILFALTINSLNLYWGYKIINKLKRHLHDE
jgi:hypothetical protein